MKDTLLTQCEFLSAKIHFDCLGITQEEALNLKYPDLLRKIKVNYKKLALMYHPDKNGTDNSIDKMILINKILDELLEYIDPLKLGKRCNKLALISAFVKGNGTLTQNEFEYNKSFEILGITSEEVIGKPCDYILKVIYSKIKDKNLIKDLKELKKIYDTTFRIKEEVCKNYGILKENSYINNNYYYMKYFDLLISYNFYTYNYYSSNICKKYPNYKNNIKLAEYILPLMHKSDLRVTDEIKLLQKNISNIEDLIPKREYLEVLISFSNFANIICSFMLSTVLGLFSLCLLIFYKDIPILTKSQVIEQGDVKEMLKYYKFKKDTVKDYNVISSFFVYAPTIYLLNYKFPSKGKNIKLLIIASLLTISILGDILYSSELFYKMIWLEKINLILEKNVHTITGIPFKNESRSFDINNTPRFYEQLLLIITFLCPLMLIEKLIILPIIKFRVKNVDLDDLSKKNQENFPELEERNFSKKSVPFTLEHLTISTSDKNSKAKLAILGC